MTVRMFLTDLEECNVILFQFVIVFDLHGNGFVSVNVSQLNVCRVAHEESTVETSWSKSWGGRKR